VILVKYGTGKTKATAERKAQELLNKVPFTSTFEVIERATGKYPDGYWYCIIRARP